MNTEYSKIKPKEQREGMRSTLTRLRAEFAATGLKLGPVECPFCGELQAEPFCTVEGQAYQRCVCCGSLYNSPRLSSTDLARYYAFIAGKVNLHKVPHCKRGERIGLIMVPRWQMIKSRLVQLGVSFPVSQVLEVGPGVGYFTEVIQDDECALAYVLMEPDPDCMESLIRLENSRIFNGIVEDCPLAEFGGNDIIFLNSIIEHPYNLHPFFERIRNLLVPGGYVSLVDMHCDGLDIQVLRSQTDNVQPFNILQIGSVAGVEKLASLHGLQLVQVFSAGQMDADILYEFALDCEPDHPLAGFASILAKPEVRLELQQMLRKHLLTGYNGYILQRLS